MAGQYFPNTLIRTIVICWTNFDFNQLRIYTKSFNFNFVCRTLVAGGELQDYKCKLSAVTMYKSVCMHERRYVHTSVYPCAKSFNCWILSVAFIQMPWKAWWWGGENVAWEKSLHLLLLAKNITKRKAAYVFSLCVCGI